MRGANESPPSYDLMLTRVAPRAWGSRATKPALCAPLDTTGGCEWKLANGSYSQALVLPVLGVIKANNLGRMDPNET